METAQTVKILGHFIVADSKVCRGQPTFRGTRVFVADVLDQVARGLDWETIKGREAMIWNLKLLNRRRFVCPWKIARNLLKSCY